MLVHKRTLGVIETVWTGKYVLVQGVSYPVDQQVRISDVDDPDEWWELPKDSKLAAKIRKLYPWMIPEIDEQGNLIGVQPDKPDTVDLNAIKEERQKEAQARGYQHAGRIRPKNLMSFLRKDNKP